MNYKQLPPKWVVARETQAREAMLNRMKAPMSDAEIQEFNARYQGEALVGEAERVLKYAANPQNSEAYSRAEGFDEFLEEGHDFAMARFLLRSSGVSIDSSGITSLHWEDQPPIIVPIENGNNPKS